MKYTHILIALLVAGVLFLGGCSSSWQDECPVHFDFENIYAGDEKVDVSYHEVKFVSHDGLAPVDGKFTGKKGTVNVLPGRWEIGVCGYKVDENGVSTLRSMSRGNIVLEVAAGKTIDASIVMDVFKGTVQQVGNVDDLKAAIGNVGNNASAVIVLNSYSYSTDTTINIDNGKKITLKSAYGFAVITRNNNDIVLLEVENGASLTIQNVIVSGSLSPNKTNPLINVSGNLVLESSGTITGNLISKDAGAVYVAAGGKFTMNGGTISGNKAANGGGVYVGADGTFTMNGGIISGNTATGKGGGVYVDGVGTFTKTGGIIYGYKASDLFGSNKAGSFPYDSNGNALYVDSSTTIVCKNDTLGVVVNYP
jgi:predicted outer membrane repeat protein